jgi:Xaa-Pro dipeptidase
MTGEDESLIGGCMESLSETENHLKPIARDEFARRRKVLAHRVAAGGMSGAIAFGRQGTASTRAGYVIYLSDYYTPFFDGLEDCVPHWAALGHAAVVVSASGEAVLVTDMKHYYFDAAVPERSSIRVVHDTNVMAGIAKAVEGLGIKQGRIGLIGQEILSAGRYKMLRQMMPGLTLVWRDELLDHDMMVKSVAELRILRYSNRVVDRIASEALAKAVAGAIEHDLADYVRRSISKAGGELLWMRPNRLAPLKDGDIYYMSIVAWFQGYFVDIAKNCIIGSDRSEKLALLNHLNDYILGQAECLKPGVIAQDAAAFGYKYFLDRESKLTRSQIEDGVLCPFPAFGHGIGLTFGKPYIREGDVTVLKPGMVIAIEANYEIANVGVAEAEVTVEIGQSRPHLLSGLGSTLV